MKWVTSEPLTPDERQLLLTLLRLHIDQQENNDYQTQFAWAVERKLLRGDHLLVIGVR